MCIPKALSPLVGLSIALAMSAGAQSTPEAESRAHCANASRIVSSGRPAHKETDALNTLAGCGKLGARTIATTLIATRTEHDLGVLERFHSYVIVWRDAELMGAAIELAKDPGATVESRVFAIRDLLWTVRPGHMFEYNRLVAGIVRKATNDGIIITPSCRISSLSSDNGGLVGTPLPADYATRIEVVLNQLNADSTTPVQVRNAAECLL